MWRKEAEEAVFGCRVFRVEGLGLIVKGYDNTQRVQIYHNYGRRPEVPFQSWLCGPHSIMVVFMDPLGWKCRSASERLVIIVGTWTLRAMYFRALEVLAKWK